MRQGVYVTAVYVRTYAWGQGQRPTTHRTALHEAFTYDPDGRFGNRAWYQSSFFTRSSTRSPPCIARVPAHAEPFVYVSHFLIWPWMPRTNGRVDYFVHERHEGLWETRAEQLSQALQGAMSSLGTALFRWSFAVLILTAGLTGRARAASHACSGSHTLGECACVW